MLFTVSRPTPRVSLRACRFICVPRCTDVCGSPSVSRITVDKKAGTDCTEGHRVPVLRPSPPGGRWDLLSNLVGFVIRIRNLMYPACILKDSCILMYPDVSQTYLTCSVTFQDNTRILTFCMYFTRIPNESKIHARYTYDTSRYMYLMRFLDVTLDTYQDTSEYMYLGNGLFITIHQDTPRYKITIHVSWTRHA